MEVNGDGAKPHRSSVKATAFASAAASAAIQDVIVRIAIDQHVKKAEARALYDDVTPKPTAEEIEARRMERVYRAAATGRRAHPIAAAAAKSADSRRVAEPRVEIDPSVPRNQEVIRQWKVLHALESSRHGASIDALAKELEVTTRTIRRDLAALQEAGFRCTTSATRRARQVATRRSGPQRDGNRLYACRNSAPCI